VPAVVGIWLINPYQLALLTIPSIDLYHFTSIRKMQGRNSRELVPVAEFVIPECRVVVVVVVVVVDWPHFSPMN
jgi:hypothetical protein